MRSARRLSPFGDMGLGDSASAGEAVEREQTALMEQQHSVGDFAHARELVGRDDRRGRSSARLMSEWWSPRVAAEAQRIIDEEQLVGARTELGQLLRSDE